MAGRDDGETMEAGTREAQAANLFDLRRIIGGLFLLYGIVLTIMGIFDSHAEVVKAAGVRINLWAGLGMIAFALFMIGWAVLRPLSREMAEADAEAAEPEGPAAT